MQFIRDPKSTFPSPGPLETPCRARPLSRLFNGFVDFAGAQAILRWNYLGHYRGGDNIFSGLDPSKRYSLKATAIRAGKPDYRNRWTVVTLLGASSFTSAHTSNTINSSLDSVFGCNQVAINTGLNTVGDLADFESIVPAGPTLMLVSMQYSNNTVVSPTGFRCNGSKGYAITGFRLEEMGGSPTSIAIINPTNNTLFVQGQNVSMSVSAGAGISSVAFYDGATLLGADNTAPYSFIYSNAALGSHTLTAVGTTGSGPVTSPQILHSGESKSASVDNHHQSYQ